MVYQHKDIRLEEERKVRREGGGSNQKRERGEEEEEGEGETRYLRYLLAKQLETGAKEVRTGSMDFGGGSVGDAMGWTRC